MPTCGNCDAHVTERYRAVHAPEGEDVGCCPACRDMTRDGAGRPRPAKSPRDGARAVDDE